MRTYELYDIVEKVNGGGIIPVGETNYDRMAFYRMKEIEYLIGYLLDDMLRVLETEGNEASISKARDEAKRWFTGLKETADEILREDEDGADKFCPKCGEKMYEDNKGILEQLAEAQNSLVTTDKAWSDAIEKNGYVN